MACGCKKQQTSVATDPTAAATAEQQRSDAARRIEVARRAAERAAAQNA